MWQFRNAVLHIPPLFSLHWMWFQIMKQKSKLNYVYRDLFYIVNCIMLPAAEFWSCGPFCGFFNPCCFYEASITSALRSQCSMFVRSPCVGLLSCLQDCTRTLFTTLFIQSGSLPPSLSIQGEWMRGGGGGVNFRQFSSSFSIVSLDSVVNFALKLFHGQQFWSLKGVWHEIFRLQVFFTNLFSPGPWVSYWGHFRFVRKFVEIFASSPVSTTAAKSCSSASMTRRYIIAGVVVTGDKLSPVSLMSYIKPCSGFSLFPWHRWLAFTFEYLCEFS